MIGGHLELVDGASQSELFRVCFRDWFGEKLGQWFGDRFSKWVKEWFGDWFRHWFGEWFGKWFREWFIIILYESRSKHNLDLDKSRFRSTSTYLLMILKSITKYGSHLDPYKMMSSNVAK